MTYNKVHGTTRGTEGTMRAEGGPSCPSSKVVLFILSTLHYVGADYFVTEKPPPLPPDATKTQIPPPGNSPLPCCIESPVLGFRHHCVSTVPHHHRNQALALDFAGCGLALATTTASTYQQPPTDYNPRKRAFLFRFRGLWGSEINLPPQPPRSSTNARFWWLWAFSGPPRRRPTDSPLQPLKLSICACFQWLWAFSGGPATTTYQQPPQQPPKSSVHARFGSCQLSLAATTATTYQWHPCPLPALSLPII